jgi:hypothetical protein
MLAILAGRVFFQPEVAFTWNDATFRSHTNSLPVPPIFSSVLDLHTETTAVINTEIESRRARYPCTSVSGENHGAELSTQRLTPGAAVPM